MYWKVKKYFSEEMLLGNGQVKQKGGGVGGGVESIPGTRNSRQKRAWPVKGGQRCLARLEHSEQWGE